MMNLLTEPVFRAATATGMQVMSLPDLLAALGKDEMDCLLGLQRHQEDAFHIFLCYLAGAVLARERAADPMQDAAFWRTGIRRLTGRDDDCAWTLAVADVTQPAFMQSPVPSAGEFNKEFNTVKTAPDELDLLLTAKNHDLKAARLTTPAADDWVFALVSLQTMCGYILKHQGIARMNSGLGSRSCVSLIYDSSVGARWRRDVRKLLAERLGLLVLPWPYRDDGIVLTWLPPWDRKSSLDLEQLDPFFIECARSVRLIQQQDRLIARTGIEKAPRVNAKALSGVLGDPWIPINCTDKKKGQSALTVAEAGFTPKLLRDLLFEDGFSLTAMQRYDADQGNRACVFQAAVLVRGQGTTDGFHEKQVLIPGKIAARLFGGGGQRNQLAELSKTGLNDAGQMQSRVLWPALLSLLQAGPEKISADKREINHWIESTIRQYADAWAAEFFRWLWETVDNADPKRSRLDWLRILRTKAQAALENAIDRFPQRAGRRYRARVRAEGLFFGSLYKHFPDLKEDRHDSAHTG